MMPIYCRKFAGILLWKMKVFELGTSNLIFLLLIVLKGGSRDVFFVWPCICSRQDSSCVFPVSCILFNGTFANSVDPDQTPKNAASDQGLHCLHKYGNSYNK